MVWHGRGCESVIPVDDAEMPHFADWAECVAYLDGKRLGLGYRQELTAVSDDFLSIAVGEKSKVPDLHKSARQYMQEIPPDELNGIQGCLFDLVAILRIAPAKADPSILQLEQSSIGYGHAVCVSGQILEHWLWSPERGLGVNDPLLLAEGREEVSEADRVGEFADSPPVEFETVCGKRLFQISEELAAE